MAIDIDHGNVTYDLTKKSEAETYLGSCQKSIIFPSCRNHSIDLLCEWTDWFLYNRS